MRKIFLLEDDISLISGLSFSFKKQGYECNVAKSIAEAKMTWVSDEYDLLILDVSLPDGTGFDFCQFVREKSNVPILFLTASDEEMNIIMGLDMGADDYITKPFKLGVLMSRINAIFRRIDIQDKENVQSQSILSSNKIKVNLLEGVVYKEDRLVELSAGEYKLLCLFMKNPNIILSKEAILEKLWDCDENFIDSSALTVYIRRLRVKVEDNPSEPVFLQTIRGLGYKWSVLEG